MCCHHSPLANAAALLSVPLSLLLEAPYQLCCCYLLHWFAPLIAVAGLPLADICVAVLSLVPVRPQFFSCNCNSPLPLSLNAAVTAASAVPLHLPISVHFPPVPLAIAAVAHRIFNAAATSLSVTVMISLLCVSSLLFRSFPINLFLLLLSSSHCCCHVLCSCYYCCSYSDSIISPLAVAAISNTAAAHSILITSPRCCYANCHPAAPADPLSSHHQLASASSIYWVLVAPCTLKGTKPQQPLQQQVSARSSVYVKPLKTLTIWDTRWTAQAVRYVSIS